MVARTMRRLPAPRLVLLSFAHFTVDAYSSFVTPLLPLLVAKLDLSLGRVGALVALSSISSSLSQPLFGWFADHLRRPWFVAFGPLVAAAFLSVVGWAGDFWALAALLVIGGLGTAAFHPQGAALTSALGGSRGISMSLFVTGGTLGYALGPLYAVSVAGRFGLQNTWLAALPGLLVAGALVAWLARLAPPPRSAASRPAWSELRPVARPLTLLYFAVVCRSAVSYGFAVYLPLLLERRGVSLAQGGATLSAYLAVGAIGGLAGGWLADRFGGRRVVYGSFLGALPLYYGFVLLPGAAGLACLMLGSLVLQASLPVNVVLGQELSPRHASTISSLLMGAAWGLGALLVGPIGALADVVGLGPALGTLASLLLAGACCAHALLHERTPAIPPETVVAAAPAPLIEPAAD